MTAEIDYTILESSIQSAISANNSLALDLLLQTHPAYKVLAKVDLIRVLLKHGGFTKCDY